MMLDKIKNFYDARANYFKKKQEIDNAMVELEHLLYKANYALSDTIDNGFDNEYVVKVAEAYEKHKFGSAIVQEFLEKIDEMFFKGIDDNLKDGLEIVSLKIGLDCKYGDARVISPIKIYVSNAQSNRHFTISVPIKNVMNADMIDWNETKEGLYVLWVNSPNTNKNKEACCVFDYSKVPSAIEKYLKGEFDKELDVDASYVLDMEQEELSEQEALSNNAHKYFAYTYKPMASAYSYEYGIDREYGIKYIDRHDLFGWRTSSPLKASSRLSNCIDDRRDYK